MMRKSIFLLLLPLFCILLCACSNTDEPKGIDYTIVDIPQLGKYSQRVYHTAQGKLTPESIDDTVSVMAESPTSDAINTEVYLSANHAGTVTTYPLGQWETVALQNGMLTLRDIDNDGTDEIFLWLEVTGNGGTLTHVYKYVDGALVLWQDLEDIDIVLQGEFLKGHKLRLFNESMRFDVAIDLTGKISLEHVDADDKIRLTPDIQELPLRSCTVDNGYVSCIRPVRHNGGYVDLETRFVYDSAQGRLVPDGLYLSKLY